MPKVQILFKATLENIEKLNVASPDWFHFKINCTHCRTTSSKEVAISSTESTEVVKASVNLSYRCAECKRTSTMNVLRVLEYTSEQNEQWAPIVELECRGIEPAEPTLFGTKFTATSEGGATFNDVSLEDDWADYDAKNDCSVSILEPELKVD